MPILLLIALAVVLLVRKEASSTAASAGAAAAAATQQDTATDEAEDSTGAGSTGASLTQAVGSTTDDVDVATDIITAVGAAAGAAGVVLLPVLEAGVNLLDEVIAPGNTNPPNAGLPVVLPTTTYQAGPVPSGYDMNTNSYGSGLGQWANRTPDANLPAAGQKILFNEKGPYFYPLVLPKATSPTLWFGFPYALLTGEGYNLVGMSDGTPSGNKGAGTGTGAGASSSAQWDNMLGIMALTADGLQAIGGGPEADDTSQHGYRLVLHNNGNLYLFGDQLTAQNFAGSFTSADKWNILAY